MDWMSALKIAVINGDDFENIRKMVSDIILSGVDREEVVSRINELRLELSDAADEKSEDTILDLLDLLYGWRTPHMRL